MSAHRHIEQPAPINAAWNDFKAEALALPRTEPLQQQDARRAYYCGAKAMTQILTICSEMDADTRHLYLAAVADDVRMFEATVGTPLEAGATLLPPIGTEARVCNDIAERQQLGIAKYGQTVADNPLSLQQWLQHAYEECLDQAVYLRRAIEELRASDPPHAPTTGDNA